MTPIFKCVTGFVKCDIRFLKSVAAFFTKNRAKSKNLKHEVFEMCLDIRSSIKQKVPFDKSSVTLNFN